MTINDYDKFMYWKTEGCLDLDENIPVIKGNIYENPELVNL